MAYLYWELFAFLIPTAAFGYWQRKLVKKYFTIFAWATLGALLFAWPWDYLMIESHTWDYHNDKILGLWFGGLPIEEWVFIFPVTWLFTLFTLTIWSRYGTK